jgi:ELWxxDGT repeat protein
VAKWLSALLVGITLWNARLTAAPLPTALADINTGTGNSNPQSFVERNGKLYFTAIAPGGTQRQLYSYDPTLAAGSQVVKVSNFAPPTATTTYPNSLMLVGTKLVMVASASANGAELCEYDPAGGTFTEMAIDGTDVNTPTKLLLHEGKVYFMDSTGARPSGQGNQLFVYDPALAKAPVGGANPNPKRLTNLNPSSPSGCSPNNLLGLPGKVLFAATLNYADNQTCCGGGFQSPDDTELVMLDTATQAITTFDLAVGSVTLKFNSTPYPDYFDSSPLGVRVVVGGDTAYFSANITEGGTWRGNVLMKFKPSTMSAPVKVAELNSDSGVVVADVPGFGGILSAATYAVGDNITAMALVGTKIYYSANNGSSGQELFVCDTANDAVTLAADLASGGPGSSPAQLTAFNGHLYFQANAGTGHGNELWEFNTTANTATELADINAGTTGSNPAGFLPYQGNLYFRAVGAGIGTELYLFDPVSRNVSLVVDLFAGSGTGSSSFNSALPGVSSYPNAYILNGDLIFAGNNGTTSPGVGSEPFHFSSPPLPPAITSVTAPANASYRASQNLDFSVVFAQPVIVETLGGSPSLALTIGATARSAAYLSGSGSATLQFRYVVQAGEVDTNGISLSSLLALNGGVITGTNDLAATLTFTPPNTSNVLVDAVAPQISSITRKTPSFQTLETNTVVFTVTFSEIVTGVAAPRFVVTPVNGSTVTGTVGSISGGPTVYDVTVNVTAGRGEFRLDVPQP